MFPKFIESNLSVLLSLGQSVLLEDFTGMGLTAQPPLTSKLSESPEHLALAGVQIRCCVSEELNGCSSLGERGEKELSRQTEGRAEA